jgi:hypothetical protein
MPWRAHKSVVKVSATLGQKSARIRAEWMRNLSERLGERSFNGNTVERVQRIAAAMDTAFPDAAIEFECAEATILKPVHVKDRHVVAAAMAVQADAIVTFNITDFARVVG